MGESKMFRSYAANDSARKQIPTQNSAIWIHSLPMIFSEGRFGGLQRTYDRRYTKASGWSLRFISLIIYDVFEQHFVSFDCLYFFTWFHFPAAFLSLAFLTSLIFLFFIDTLWLLLFSFSKNSPLLVIFCASFSSKLIACSVTYSSVFKKKQTNSTLLFLFLFFPFLWLHVFVLTESSDNDYHFRNSLSCLPLTSKSLRRKIWIIHLTSLT